MNNNIKTNNSFLQTTSTFIKDNLKKIIILFAGIFFIFLTFQIYTYYKVYKINKQSIAYFINKNLDDDLTKYSEMSKISSEKGFYSILSKLELIKTSIHKSDFDKSLLLYDEILNSNNLDKNYISLIAINASYNFIEVVNKNKNKNKNMKYINNINIFISLIDDGLDNYIGNKNELLYLVSILSLNDDSNYKNNSELLTLYDNMMNNEKISSTIKERVKKIHEFYIFI